MKKDEIIERLEFYDGGDGVEFQVWIDPKTKQLYSVPMELVRNFDGIEKVCSEYCAKFGGCSNCE